MAKEQGEEMRPRKVSAGCYDGRMLLRHIYTLFLTAEDPICSFSNPSITLAYGVCEDVATLNGGACPFDRRYRSGHWRRLVTFAGEVYSSR